jgi:uncharacterized protein (DUF1501 family)
VRGSFSSLGLPVSGWVARYADANAPDPFGAVYVGHGRPAALVGGATPRFMSTNLSRYRFEYPSNLANHLHPLTVVRQVLAARGGWGSANSAGQAAELAHSLTAKIESAAIAYQSSVAYPTNNTLAADLRDAAILMQAGFGTRIFYCGTEGFDTHARQGALAGTQALLLRRLDAALTAFAKDLRDMGAWSRTVLAVVSEFGRRNYDNNSGGTDHGGGNCVLLCGGAVRGGFFGTHLTEADLSQEFTPWEVDFRSVYAEVLRSHLGVADVDAVFPEPGSIAAPLGFV